MTTRQQTDMDVIGKSSAEQASEDALAASLGRLAYAIPSKDNRRSRFWFKLDTPPIEQIKEAMKPRELEHIDSEIVDRLEAYKAESPPILQKHIEDIREFFLTEIAPKTLATSGGTIQATEVVRRLLDTEVDGSTVSRFQNMVNRATTLKMAMFVCKYFGLPDSYLDSIVGNQPSQSSPQEQAVRLMSQLALSQQRTDGKVDRIWREIRDRPNE